MALAAVVNTAPQASPGLCPRPHLACGSLRLSCEEPHFAWEGLSGWWEAAGLGEMVAAPSMGEEGWFLIQVGGEKAAGVHRV